MSAKMRTGTSVKMRPKSGSSAAEGRSLARVRCKGNDAHEHNRHSAGITNGRVFRSAEDPNDVVVLQDALKARTFVVSEDLKAAIKKNGVIRSPSFRFAA
jgi:hypothetical protein